MTANNFEAHAFSTVPEAAMIPDLAYLDLWEEGTARRFAALQDKNFARVEALLGMHLGLIKAREAGSVTFGRFARDSDGEAACATACVGSFSSLLVTRKLLRQGHFLHMHAPLRMAVEWAQIGLCLEADPSLGAECYRKGVSGSKLKRAIAASARSDLRVLFRAMKDTLETFSQGAHVNQRAVSLTVVKVQGAEKRMAWLAGGFFSTTFSDASSAVATICADVLEVFSRHAVDLPAQWLSEFTPVMHQIMKEASEQQTDAP